MPFLILGFAFLAFAIVAVPALYAVASVFVALALLAVAAGLIGVYWVIPRRTVLRKAWLWVSVLPYSAYVLVGGRLGNVPPGLPEPLKWAAWAVLHPWREPAFAQNASPALAALRAGDALKTEAVVVLGLLAFELLLWGTEVLVEAGLDRAFGPVDPGAAEERRTLRWLYDAAQGAERLTLPVPGGIYPEELLRGYSRSGVRLSRNAHNAREALAREQGLWDAVHALREASERATDPDVFLLGVSYARRALWAWRQVATRCLRYERPDELGESLLASAGLEPRLREVHDRLANADALGSGRRSWAEQRVRALKRSRWKTERGEG